jgi:hypothetical protein
MRRSSFLDVRDHLVQHETVVDREIAVERIEQFRTRSALRRLPASINTSAGDRSAISALTIARPATPWISLTTTDKRMPPSESILCARFFSLGENADQLLALPCRHGARPESVPAAQKTRAACRLAPASPATAHPPNRSCGRVRSSRAAH